MSDTHESDADQVTFDEFRLDPIISKTGIHYEPGLTIAAPSTNIARGSKQTRSPSAQQHQGGLLSDPINLRSECRSTVLIC